MSSNPQAIKPQLDSHQFLRTLPPHTNNIHIQQTKPTQAARPVINQNAQEEGEKVLSPKSKGVEENSPVFRFHGQQLNIQGADSAKKDSLFLPIIFVY